MNIIQSVQYPYTRIEQKYKKCKGNTKNNLLNQYKGKLKKKISNVTDMKIYFYISNIYVTFASI